MLTRWLTFTALLTGSANPQRAATGQRSLTIAPTCRVKAHSEVELTFNCGDRKNTGVVQYWHTPFGDLHTSGFHSELEPVFMHLDGSLVVPNSSSLHSGLYYCLLQHTEGTTLWPYELHVGYNNLNNQERGEYEQGSSCDTIRLKRDVGPEKEDQPGVSDGQFAGAVAASVLLTFVLGFSAGALTRAYVLRCFEAVTTRVRSPLRHCQTDMPDHGCEVTIATLPLTYDNKAFEMGQMQDNISVETTMSTITSSPPAKPQRSFRHKREENHETTAYLEGCDYIKEDEKGLEENGGLGLEERSNECGRQMPEEKVEIERKLSGSYLLREGGGSEEDKDKNSEHGEDKDERESTENNKEWGEEEKAGEQKNSSKEDDERSGDEASYKEKGKDEKREKEGWKEGDNDGENKGEEDICRDSLQSSTDTEDEEMGSKKLEETVKNDIITERETRSSPHFPARRSRVIRLYQYNEDGERYCHLPDSSNDDPAPPPRLKQRSVSLTRLNAIMAAASAGPLYRRETGEEERERPHFHMEI